MNFFLVDTAYGLDSNSNPIVEFLSLFPHAGHSLSFCHELPEFCYPQGSASSLFQVIDNDTPGPLEQYNEKMEHSIVVAFNEKVANGIIGGRKT